MKKKSDKRQVTSGHLRVRPSEAGIERLCDMIADCRTLKSIAVELGCSTTAVFDFLSRPENSARASLARGLAAQTHEQAAIDALDEIDDDATEGRRLRQRLKSEMHIRLAGMKNRRDYGQSSSVALELRPPEETLEEINARLLAYGVKVA